MGLEARCMVNWQSSRWTAAIHLDSAALEVRGRPRLVVALSDVRRVSVADGDVTIETKDGLLTLGLGAAAEQWARKIASPPTRGKKLGITAGLRVSVVGLGDAAFEAELASLGADRVGASAKADVIFLGVAEQGDLAGLRSARARIEPDGAIWVVRTKGKTAKLKEGEVRDAARAAGLVDVKVAAFSETLSADKFVIPVAERQPKETPTPARAKKARPPADKASSRAKKARPETKKPRAPAKKRGP